MSSLLPALLLLACLPLLVPAPPSANDSGVVIEEVVVHHPGGELLRRYEVDEEGRKHGAFEEFEVDGTLRIKARYAKGELDGREQRFFASGKRQLIATWKAGVLHGRYETFYESGGRELSTGYKRGLLTGKHKELSEDGKWVLSATYQEDVLTGTLTVKDHGKTLTQQKWKAGRLLELDGIVPFPRERDALVQELAAILATPEHELAAASDGSVPDDPLAHDRAAALRRLQAYRALCHLPWREMSLVAEWNSLCDAASELCRRLGGLSHTPERPPDTDDRLYADGRRGASNSNLAMGSSLPGSVDSYMDDSDPSNIDRIGHRRWCLNPAMKRTGFGKSDGFSAMWSMDQSGGGVRGLDAVQYPPPGHVPSEMFGAAHAWSITPVSGSLPRKEKVRVDLQPLGEHYLPVGEPLEIDYLNVSGGGYGAGPCLIFRPASLDLSDDSAYRCRISFDGGRSWEYDYLVQFTSDERLRGR